MSLRLRTPAAALLAVSLTMLGACDRLPTEETGLEGVGAAAFTYDGDASGRYFALGAPEGESGTTPTGEEFAAAVHYVVNGTPLGTAVTSRARIRAHMGDHLHLQFPGALQPGTFTVGSCGRMPFCPGVNLVFDVDARVDGGGSDARYFTLTSGSITISSVENGRIRGTFSGTATQTFPSEGAGRQIVVSHGTFDVPIVREVDLAGGG